MDLGAANILLAIGGGLASVLSPCVLPVIPVIVAGAESRDRLRPLLVVTGLSITFMAMGAVSSLFGALLIGRTQYIEQAGGLIIAVIGLMIVLDINVFKRLYRLSNIQVSSDGRLGGLILGMALGLVWIPCVGPVLSGILAMVGTSGRLADGISLLGFYSLGFAVPMLAVSYSSHAIQRRLGTVTGHEKLLRYLTGGVLLGFGLYTVFVGNFAF
jgi:cytochrome c-type biogenesis protein